MDWLDLQNSIFLFFFGAYLRQTEKNRKKIEISSLFLFFFEFGLDWAGLVFLFLKIFYLRFFMLGKRQGLWELLVEEG